MKWTVRVKIKYWFHFPWKVFRVTLREWFCKRLKSNAAAEWLNVTAEIALTSRIDSQLQIFILQVKATCDIYYNFTPIRT